MGTDRKALHERVLPIGGGRSEVGGDMAARHTSERRSVRSRVVPGLVLALSLALLLVGGLPSTSTAAPGAVTTARAASAPDSLFPTVGNSGYDVSSYGIDLRFHRGAGSITASTAIVAHSTGRLASFTLDLEGLTVDSVTVDGTAARWRRSGHKLRIVPQRAVVGRFVTTIAYHGVPSTHTDPDGADDGWIPKAGGATVLSEPVGAMTWFPVNNVPRDKATFRIAVTVPGDLEVAGNGVLSKHHNPASTTWTWRQRQPMAPYLAMISIGQYDVYHSSMRLLGGRRIPVWSFVEHGLPTAAVRHAHAARELLPSVVRFEERRYGAYPFDSVGIVVADLGVGYALETQTRPVFDGDIDTSTLVHELAHQWFGDSVTPCDWGDIWLNEGFASYAETLWTAAHGGPSAAAQFDTAYAGAEAAFWSPAPAALSDPADLFSDPVYARGGMTLQVLRERIGSAAFFATLHRWARQNAGGCVSTGGFVATAEHVSGRSLDVLVDDWLYTARKPVGY